MKKYKQRHSPFGKKRRPQKKKAGGKRPLPAQNEEPRQKLNRRGLHRIADDEVRETILQLCREAGLESAVRPEKIAQTLYPEKWQSLLKRVRLMGKQMALAGDLLIMRKGKPADPEEAKGLTRFRITEQGMSTDEEE